MTPERDPTTGRYLRGADYKPAVSSQRKIRKAQQERAMRAFDEAITDNDWNAIARTAIKKAIQGNVKWATLLFDRVLGRPLQQIDVTAIPAEADNIIEVFEEQKEEIKEIIDAEVKAIKETAKESQETESSKTEK